MVYPLELVAGAVLLVVGYRLHMTCPMSDDLERGAGVVGTARSAGNGDASRRSVVAEQAAGAALCVLGLVLVIDGLGL